MRMSLSVQPEKRGNLDKEGEEGQRKSMSNHWHNMLVLVSLTEHRAALPVFGKVTEWVSEHH